MHFAAAGAVCILAAAGQTGQQAVEQVVKQCMQNSSMDTHVRGSCKGGYDSKAYRSASHSFCVIVNQAILI